MAYVIAYFAIAVIVILSLIWRYAASIEDCSDFETQLFLLIATIVGLFWPVSAALWVWGRLRDRCKKKAEEGK